MSRAVPFGADWAFPTPNADIARDFLDGRYRFAGLSPAAHGPGGRPVSPWALTPPSDRWAAELHGFAWAHHLRAAPRAGPKRAAALVEGWLKRPRSAFPAVAWRPDVAARRLLSWLDLEPMMFPAHEPGDPERRDEALRRHMRACRSARRGGSQWSRALTAIAGARAAVRLGGSAGGAVRSLKTAVKVLNDVVEYSDGLPDRRADQAVELLAQCLILRAAAMSLDERLQDPFDDIIGRVASALCYVRHRDGASPVFHGGASSGPDRVDALLERAHARPAVLGAARAGYRRMAGGDSACIIDMGSRPGGDAGGDSVGAFEFGGAKRIIVGCGAPDSLPDRWLAALRGPAAWSGLSLAPPSGVVLERTPMNRTTLKETEEGSRLQCGIRLAARKHGVIHERCLTLSSDGGRLAGTETLSWLSEPWSALAAAAFAVRFHLHPLVRASMTRDGRQILLAFEDGEGWTFEAEGATLSLDASVHAGDGAIRRTRQIVLDGVLGEAQEPRLLNCVNWTLRRL